MLQTLRLLLPALIPSWNFFEVIAESPRVEYARSSFEGEAALDWREFRPRPRRLSVPAMLGRLFWNARWNEALFVVSCAERLLDAPTAHSQDEIFKRIAADLVDCRDPGGDWLRFRILLVSEEGGAPTREIAFVSEPRPLSSLDVR